MLLGGQREFVCMRML